jgi:hypothetical protein
VAVPPPPAGRGDLHHRRDDLLGAALGLGLSVETTDLECVTACLTDQPGERSAILRLALATMRATAAFSKAVMVGASPRAFTRRSYRWKAGSSGIRMLDTIDPFASSGLGIGQGTARRLSRWSVPLSRRARAKIEVRRKSARRPSGVNDSQRKQT